MSMSNKVFLSGADASSLTTAEEYHPRYTDAFDMRYGLFIHWVGCSPTQGSGLRYSDGSSTGIRSINKYAESLDVEKAADEVKALGFEYVIITDFHGLGTMLHPSAASDKWRGEGYASKRDVIGEMIAALKKRGIGFILFTHPLDGHDYPPEHKEILGWNDPTDGYRKWNDFINDVYAELAETYGNTMMGMGFDSEFATSGDDRWKGKLDRKRLRETILARAPKLQLYALVGPNETCEFGHKEVWRPSWLDPWMSRTETDYDVETWPAYRRVISVVQPAHWATITRPEEGITHLTAGQLYRYTVLQAAVATEGPGCAWAASPYPDGTWEKGVREVFAQVAEYMNPVRGSLAKVYPSTSYPTPEGATIAGLPLGFVATKATNDTVEYIHVLNPPKGKSIKLPPPVDGKKFCSATLAANGRKVEMTHDQDGVTLTLGQVDEWDPLNTVIALTVEAHSIPRQNLALHQKVSASDAQYSTPALSWRDEAGLTGQSEVGLIRLVDGHRSLVEKSREWSTDIYGYSSELRMFNGVQWVSVDLGNDYEINEVRLYPRREGVGFPVDYEVLLSLNGTSWETVALRSGVDGRNDVYVEKFKKTPARYVRFVGTKLRQDTHTGLFGLQLVELEVFGDQ
jgi:alpha-L-fucosidase